MQHSNWSRKANHSSGDSPCKTNHYIHLATHCISLVQRVRCTAEIQCACVKQLCLVSSGQPPCRFGPLEWAKRPRRPITYTHTPTRYLFSNRGQVRFVALCATCVEVATTEFFPKQLIFKLKLIHNVWCKEPRRNTPFQPKVLVSSSATYRGSCYILITSKNRAEDDASYHLLRSPARSSYHPLYCSEEALWGCAPC